MDTGNKRARPLRMAQQNAQAVMQTVFSNNGAGAEAVASSATPPLPAPVASTPARSGKAPGAAPGTSQSAPGKRSATPTNTQHVDVESMSPDDRIALMRRNAPIIYDSLWNHSLDWGSLSVCWGGAAEKKIVIDGVNYTDEHNTEQVLYVACRTDGEYDPSARTWSGAPGELFVHQVAVAKPRTVQRHSVSKFREHLKSSRVTVAKRLIHPGEINRLRALPEAPHLVATQTDSPIVYVWNVQTQPHRTENMSSDDKAKDANAPGGSQTPASKGGRGRTGQWLESCKCSVPDFELIGHKEGPSQGALDTKGKNCVLSGGKSVVLLWNLADAQGSSQIKPRCVFKGHSDMVEDCSFRPGSVESEPQLCSVGHDRSLLLWDARNGYESAPYAKANDIHTEDANCCAWSAKDLILTGGSDGAVHIFDTRKLSKKLSTVQLKEEIFNVRWSPDDSNVFLASGSGFLNLYRLTADGKCELIFRHLGHRATLPDVQFNPLQPWTLASVSDDSADESKGGGGSLQTWRVSEFIYRSLSDPQWSADLEQAVSKTNKDEEDLNEDDSSMED